MCGWLSLIRESFCKFCNSLSQKDKLLDFLQTANPPIGELVITANQETPKAKFSFSPPGSECKLVSNKEHPENPDKRVRRLYRKAKRVGNQQ